MFSINTHTQKKDDLLFSRKMMTLCGISLMGPYVLLSDSWEDFSSYCTRSKTTSSLWVFWKRHGGGTLLFCTFLSRETRCRLLLSIDGTPTDKYEPRHQEEDSGRSPPGCPEELRKTGQRTGKTEISWKSVISLVLKRWLWTNAPDCLHKHNRLTNLTSVL